MAEIRSSTRVLGVIGRPVRHSLSPALHNAWLRHHDIDAVYLALETPPGSHDVPGAIRALGLMGANITVPHKQAVFDGVDRRSPAALACGSVNTVVCEPDGTLIGHNTDGDGFLDALAEVGLDPSGRRVSLLGAGGAARAVAVALARAGVASIAVFNRTRTHAQALADAIDAPVSVHPLTPEAFGAMPSELVVQTLPGAGREAVRALPLAPVEGAWVDLNYWDPDPPHTAALAASGHLVQSGHAMLLYQAARAFTLFTAVTPDISVGRRVLEAESGGCQLPAVVMGDLGG